MDTQKVLEPTEVKETPIENIDDDDEDIEVDLEMVDVESIDFQDTPPASPANAKSTQPISFADQDKVEFEK